MGVALWLVHSTVFPDTQTHRHTHTDTHTHWLEPSQSFSHRLTCPSKLPQLPVCPAHLWGWGPLQLQTPSSGGLWWVDRSFSPLDSLARHTPI